MHPDSANAPRSFRTRTVRLARVAAVLAVGGTIAALALAGPLDPPAGPVTSTYKTLGEIMPEIAINAANTPGDATCKFKITQPGSYYLPGNMLGDTGTHEIKIALGPSGGHVSIDMRGFTLRGVPGSLNGIHVADGQTLTSCSISGGGQIDAWGGYGIYTCGMVGSGIVDTKIRSAGLGCVKVVAGGGGTITIESCSMRSTSGMGLITEVGFPLMIRNSVIEGDGCNTTSLISLGGDTTIEGLTVRARDSIFSAPVIAVSTGAACTGREMRVYMSSCTAPSSLRIGPGSGGAAVSELDFNLIGSVFSTAVFEHMRDGMLFRNVRVRADATTTSPVMLRLAANNSYFYDPDLGEFVVGIPIAVDVIGSNNTISGGSMRTAGTGIRLAGASNTVTGCRIFGSGASSIIGVLISLGSTNNLVTKNEFVSVGGGVAVNNLGGSSNGVAPIVTPGNIGSATNPFSNIQH